MGGYYVDGYFVDGYYVAGYYLGEQGGEQPPDTGDQTAVVNSYKRAALTVIRKKKKRRVGR